MFRVASLFLVAQAHDLSVLRKALSDAQALEAQTKQKYETLTHNAISAANSAIAAMKDGKTDPKEDLQSKVQQAKELKQQCEDMLPMVNMVTTARQNAEEELQGVTAAAKVGTSEETTGTVVASVTPVTVTTPVVTTQASATAEGRAVKGGFIQEPTERTVATAEGRAVKGGFIQEPTERFNAQDKMTSMLPGKLAEKVKEENKNVAKEEVGSSTLSDQYVTLMTDSNGVRKNTLFAGAVGQEGHLANWLTSLGQFLGFIAPPPAAPKGDMRISPKQDAAATQRAVELESQRIIDISDSFKAQEDEDKAVLRQVKARQHYFDKRAGDQYPDDARNAVTDFPSVQVHTAFAALEHVDDQIDRELMSPESGPQEYRSVRALQDKSMEMLESQINEQESHGSKTKLTLLQKSATALRTGA